jgi:hypothetical protein
VDWEALSAIAGLFLFLPLLAIHLLIAPDKMTPPALPKGAGQLGLIDDATATKFLADIGQWVGTVGISALAVNVIACFAELAIAYFYVGGAERDVRGSLIAALWRLPIYLVATFLTAFPVAIGYLLLILPAFYVLGRVALIAPAIAAERGVGPIDALTRSFALTRGHTLTMMSLMILVVVAGFSIQQPLLTLDGWILTNAPNPIARALLDAVIALGGTMSALAMVLVQIAAYRRLRTR